MREVAGTQLDSTLLELFLALGENVLEALECDCEVCRQRRQYYERLTDEG